ncbi:MAG: 2OG-Fe(II) oxygenase [Gammaproteobacteria bacterium]|nr:MAG: 2OG-Fe(II) oxygenase [Gammaproteobacteria bacterium]
MWSAVVDGLVDTGYAIVDGALGDWLCQKLRREAMRLSATMWQAAGIGRNEAYQINTQVRNDEIVWLPQDSPACAEFLKTMESLRLAVNQALYLGLFSYEAHFARYAPGHFYQKHFDAFHGQRGRVLTTVYYLNPGWRPEDGGELYLYDAMSASEPCEVVVPVADRLVVFLSERFPHEVRPAGKTRYSIAGWFRIHHTNPLLSLV